MSVEKKIPHPGVLYNQIREVEEILLESAIERDRLRHYDDAQGEIKALTSYMHELTLLLQRTNLFFYQTLHDLATVNDFNVVYNLFKEMDKEIVQNNKDRGKICLEVENYYLEKLKIERLYKNLFSEKDRTIASKSRQLEEVERVYDYFCPKGRFYPHCTVLDGTELAVKGDWRHGILEYDNEEDVGLTLEELMEKYNEPNIENISVGVLLPPKPITRESVQNNENDEEK